MFDFSYSLKDFFFDRQAVAERLSAGERRAMSKIGAFIRTSAKQSIKRRKRVSAPGNPPHAHSTDKVATLKNILFGYDPREHKVLVGPTKLNQAETDWISLQQTTVPALHEFGGVALIKEERWKSNSKEYSWHRRDMRRNLSESKEYRTRRAIFKKRPFMGPALERESRNGKLINAWREIL